MDRGAWRATVCGVSKESTLTATEHTWGPGHLSSCPAEGSPKSA